VTSIPHEKWLYAIMYQNDASLREGTSEKENTHIYT